jgi:hypothetical protein
MKTIYSYVLDTMADREVGYATAELSSQRYFTNIMTGKSRHVPSTRGQSPQWAA